MGIDHGVLTSFDTLAPLGDSGLRAMAPLLDQNTYRAGSQICREGDAGEACYMLAEGTVDVIKNLPDGRRVKLATLPPGTLFGQAGLVPGQLRTAEVKANGNVTILSLNRARLDWSLRRGEDWAIAMQAIIAVNLVKQLRTALSRLGELAESVDPRSQVTGTRRRDAKRPIALNPSFSRVKARAKIREERARAAEAADEAMPDQPDEVVSAVPSDAPLLELLRATESSLASAGWDTDNIEFVIDDTLD